MWQPKCQQQKPYFFEKIWLFGYRPDLGGTKKEHRRSCTLYLLFTIKELNAEIIREFVDRIYVHQTERINGRKIQRIRIVWNCIGEFTPPVPEQEKETA